MAKKKAIKKRLYNLTHFLQATHFHPELNPFHPCQKHFRSPSKPCQKAFR